MAGDLPPHLTTPAKLTAAWTERLGGVFDAWSVLSQSITVGYAQTTGAGGRSCFRGAGGYHDPMDWHQNLVTEAAHLRALLAETTTVAVLGIKTEAQAGQPAFYVPRYLAAVGYEVIPVPVYYPEVTHILGRAVYRRLSEIPVAVDIVEVFRRAEDLPGHVEDIMAKQPKAVWLQSGIRHDAVAQQLAEAGIKVVQDRCMMVDHRALL